jgi:hypothetical protein
MRRIITVLAIAAMTLGLGLVAHADTEHGRPAACTAADEASHGSRDGFDHRHHTNPAVANSLADSEGFINVCRTNDALVVEHAQGGASVERMSGVNRAQLHPQLQHWNGTAWVLAADGPSVNTGNNRTLSVVTTEVDTSGVTTGGWYRTNVRVLLRYSNYSLQFSQWQTYAIWAGDGPATTPIPS